MNKSLKMLLSLIFIILFVGSALFAYMQYSGIGSRTVIVILETSRGSIEVEIDMSRTPITSNNFLAYVNNGFYNETVFHRVIYNMTSNPPFAIIQAGGYTADGNAKQANDPIKLESNRGLSNVAGTIAMARTNEADSATSHFYINVVDNTFLDYVSNSSPGYAVFGKVVKGMEIVIEISKVSAGVKLVNIPNYGLYPFENWPKQNIIIFRAYVKK